MDIELLLQMAAFEITVAAGNGLTVIITEFTLVQVVAVIFSTRV